MASGLYDSARKLFADGDIDLLNDTIKVILVDTADYTVNLATHDFLDDVPSAARVATGTLASKDTTAGVFDATDVTFSSVTGDVCEALVIYKDTGVEGTSPLIGYIDGFASGMPVTPNGGNITIQWDNGANKIFKL